MTKRKKMPFESDSIYVNYESVDEAIRLIREKETAAENKGVSNIRINLDIDYDSPRLTLVGEIDETDDQMAFRLLLEDRQEERERQQLARLKAKYGE